MLQCVKIGLVVLKVKGGIKISWDKNTIKTSAVDSIIHTCRILRVPYTIEILGYVEGHGLNDELNKKYPIRKLIIDKLVVMEQMFRTNDCDADDYLVHYIFESEEAPKDWELETAYNTNMEG